MTDPKEPDNTGTDTEQEPTPTEQETAAVLEGVNE